MFRLATNDEALEVLSEPKTIERVGKVPESLLAQPWCISDGESKMIFFFWIVSDGVYEVHIASPKSDVLKSRSNAEKIIKWLFRNGADRLVTSCPEGKIANMARKVGMIESKKTGSTVNFEVSRWQLEQQ